MSNESKMIPPTVGRVLWFYPSAKAADNGFARKESGPYAAIIARVWNDRLVNLTVFDAVGVPHGRTSVLLRQAEDGVPIGSFCEWMPYQQGQAAKTEALADALKAAQPAAASLEDLAGSAAYQRVNAPVSPDLVALPVVETPPLRVGDEVTVDLSHCLPQGQAPAAGPRIPAEPRTEENHEREANDERMEALWRVILQRLEHCDTIPLAFVEELYRRMLPPGDAVLTFPHLQPAREA